MRLWSLHPQYLDSIGLVALWREALLAKAVLAGQTRGYQSHPQLIRFRSASQPKAYINQYLWFVLEEAGKRGFQFDSGKVKPKIKLPPLPVTRGQIIYEWEHLKNKLRKRNADQYRQLGRVLNPKCHPVFFPRLGKIEAWEKIIPGNTTK